MEVYGPILAGVVASLLQSLTKRFVVLSEGENATAMVLLNFVAALITIGIFWTLGIPVTLDATVVVAGVTVGANQLWYNIQKYVPGLWR